MKLSELAVLTILAASILLTTIPVKEVEATVTDLGAVGQYFQQSQTQYSLIVGDKAVYVVWNNYIPSSGGNVYIKVFSRSNGQLIQSLTLTTFAGTEYIFHTYGVLAGSYLFVIQPYIAGTYLAEKWAKYSVSSSDGTLTYVTAGERSDTSSSGTNGPEAAFIYLNGYI